MLKEVSHIKYKIKKKHVVTLTGKSNQAYHNKHFETNWDYNRNKWMGVKSLKALTSMTYSVGIYLPYLDVDNNRITTSNYDMGSLIYYICKISRKTNISYPPAVRNVSFLENFANVINE